MTKEVGGEARRGFIPITAHECCWFRSSRRIQHLAGSPLMVVMV